MIFSQGPFTWAGHLIKISNINMHDKAGSNDNNNNNNNSNNPPEEAKNK